MIYLWGISIFVALASTINVFLKMRKKAPLFYEGRFVSIIKPLKGVNDGMIEAIESFFNLEYPKDKYEIIFCVDDKDDPVIKIIEKIRKNYPQVNSKFSIGASDVGQNPKINNMYKAYINAIDLILISDDTIKVSPTYLKKMVSHLKPGTGIVTSIIQGIDQKTFAGEIESVYLNSYVPRAMMAADTIGLPAAIGKSMLFKKADADKFGGFITLGAYLAEDLMMAQKMSERGLSTALLVDPVFQCIGEYSIKTHFNRHLRWGRMRKAHFPVGFLLEPLTMPVVTGAFGSYAFYSYGIDPILFFAAHMALFSFLDLTLLKKISGNSVNRKTPLAWAFRESIAFPFWIYTLSSNKIDWKGSKLKLKMGGKIERITRKKK